MALLCIKTEHLLLALQHKFFWFSSQLKLAPCWTYDWKRQRTTYRSQSLTWWSREVLHRVINVLCDITKGWFPEHSDLISGLFLAIWQTEGHVAATRHKGNFAWCGTLTSQMDNHVIKKALPSPECAGGGKRERSEHMAALGSEVAALMFHKWRCSSVPTCRKSLDVINSHLHVKGTPLHLLHTNTHAEITETSRRGGK